MSKTTDLHLCCSTLHPLASLFVLYPFSPPPSFLSPSSVAGCILARPWRRWPHSRTSCGSIHICECGKTFCVNLDVVKTTKSGYGEFSWKERVSSTFLGKAFKWHGWSGGCLYNPEDLFMVYFSAWCAQIMAALLNQIRAGPSLLWPPKTMQYWAVGARTERGAEAEIERKQGLKANELRGTAAWDLLIEFDVKPFKNRDPVRQTED